MTCDRGGGETASSSGREARVRFGSYFCSKVRGDPGGSGTSTSTNGADHSARDRPGGVRPRAYTAMGLGATEAAAPGGRAAGQPRGHLDGWIRDRRHGGVLAGVHASNRAHGHPAGGLGDSAFLAQTGAYVLVMTLLTFSALMYLMARQGALYRSRQHHRVPRAEMDAHFGARPLVHDGAHPLVPRGPRGRAVDHPLGRPAGVPGDADRPAHRRPDRPQRPRRSGRPRWPVARCPVRSPHCCVSRASASASSLARLERVSLDGAAATTADLRALALDYVWAADWLDFESAAYPRTSTTEDFVAQEVFGALGNDCRETAAALFCAIDERADVPSERLAQLARRLAWTFTAEITSFERKAYAHLPHDANKAMNLNAYIGLMGGAYRVVDTRLGKVLRDTDDGSRPRGARVRLHPDPRRGQRARCASTACGSSTTWSCRATSASPSSRRRTRRSAALRRAWSASPGATTDIAVIVHQGLTYYDATFWVGANAVIRWQRCDDIDEVELRRRLPGAPVRAGPHRHRGHRVEHRPGRQRLDALQLPASG